VFGFNYLPRIDETNIHYGGKHPHSSRVLFVNGDIDPWHSLSVVKDTGKNSAILIQGTAHCADMIQARPGDPPGLKMAQQKVGQIIHQWLIE